MNASHSPHVDERAGDSERAQQHVVARALVVEREAAAVVADRDDAAVVVDPAADRRRARTASHGSAPYAGCSGLHDEHVLDVHHEQLLVLLLVVQAELEQLARPRRRAPVEQRAHGGVDVLAVRGRPRRRRAA